MATITNKPIKLDQVELIVEDYEKGLKGKVDTVAGKGLSTNDYDNDAQEKVNGALQVKDIETTLEGKGYATSEDLEDKFVQKENGKGLSTNDYDATAKGIVDNISSTYATIEMVNKIGTVKGDATKSQLPTLATTANLQDIWCITDDDNHWYMFVGKEATGADENGFLDLGNHLDISGKLDTSVAERDYAKKSELPTDYLTDDDIEDFLTEDDIVFATDSEVLAKIASGKQKANQAS